MFLCGTTTMLGGISCPIQDDEESKWIFAFTSLGDCKAYRWSKSSNQMSDISLVLRETSVDPRDPGGRLGPHQEDGSADLRNLATYYVECEEGDIISLVSDGVHDNLGKFCYSVLKKKKCVCVDPNFLHQRSSKYG